MFFSEKKNTKKLRNRMELGELTSELCQDFYHHFQHSA